ncbi:sensor histidine kinase [Myxococcaceae bacterium JPH2]|nr:sensor histidine kinase [Myxococcaceae bacterium JPH2]
MSAALSAVGAKALQKEPQGRSQALEPVDVPDVLQVDVAVAAHNALELLGATRRLRGVEVKLSLPDEPVIARVSRRRLEQVLLLLLAHAADTLGGESPGVRLTVEPPDDFGDVGPRFHVVTPGASLSDREIQSILLAPLLVSSPHRRLARARELLESVGGTLSVARELPSGTRVTVELPAPGLASW